MRAFDDRTALLVVDVQNDFADPAGSLAVRGALDILPAVNAAVGVAVEAGASVVYTQDWHPPTTPHFLTGGGTWPVHCVAGTWGAELHPELVVEGPLLRKGVGGEDGYSGFGVRDPHSGEVDPTRLEEMLRSRGIGRVVIAGLATDYCVVETAVDARGLDLEVDVLADAIRAVDLRPGDGERAIGRMREAGARVG